MTRCSSSFSPSALRVLATTLFCATLRAQTTECVSLGVGSSPGDDSSILVANSADGRWVAFASWATNLGPPDANPGRDVFVKDRESGAIQVVNVDPSGQQTTGDSNYPALSADGRYVAFQSTASTLVAGDTNGTYDVYVRDLQAGVTERVSLGSAGVQAAGPCLYPSLSADGRFVAFWAHAPNLVPNDTNGLPDTFVRDRLLGTTVRVSVSSAGEQANGESPNQFQSIAISGNGQVVAFVSTATNLVPSDVSGLFDVFVHDLQTGLTELANVASDGTHGAFDSQQPALSRTGRYVAFTTVSVLDPTDVDEFGDIYLRDRLTNTTTRISKSASGGATNDHSASPALSADARYVAYVSHATNVVLPDANRGSLDIYVHDRFDGSTERANVDAAGTQPAGGSSIRPRLSENGRFVFFESNAPLVVEGFDMQIYVRDRGPVCALPTSFCTAAPNSYAPGGAEVSTSGSSSVAANDLVLVAAGVPPGKTGLFFYGENEIAPVLFGNGLRCIGAPFFRLSATQANSQGGIVFPLDLATLPAGGRIASGEVWKFQFAYRDPDAGGLGYNASDAVSITFCP